MGVLHALVRDPYEATYLVDEADFGEVVRWCEGRKATYAFTRDVRTKQLDDLTEQELWEWFIQAKGVDEAFKNDVCAVYYRRGN